MSVRSSGLKSEALSIAYVVRDEPLQLLAGLDPRLRSDALVRAAI